MEMTPYRVWCYQEKRYIQLSNDEYNAQMDVPNDLWECPTCRSVAAFDDEWYKKYRTMFGLP